MEDQDDGSFIHIDSSSSGANVDIVNQWLSIPIMSTFLLVQWMTRTSSPATPPFAFRSTRLWLVLLELLIPIRYMMCMPANRAVGFFVGFFLDLAKDSTRHRSQGRNLAFDINALISSWLSLSSTVSPGCS
jgi:hypothetical protein